MSRRGEGKMGRVVGAAIALGVLFLAGTAPAPVQARQVPQQPSPTMPGQPGSQPNPLGNMNNGADPAMSARMQEQRRQMMVDERRKRIVADTDKLLQLATELKAEVDKSSKNEMSLAVIEKAAEIEKLSRDVKERMKN